MKLVRHSDYIQLDFGHLANVFGDGLIVYAGKFYIFGDPGVGKSLLMQQVLFHISEGMDWFGHEVPEAVPCAYIELEVADPKFQERAEGLSVYYSGTGEKLYYFQSDDGFSLHNERMIEELIELFKQHEIAVAVVDPLNYVLEGSENDDAVIRAAVKSMNRISRQTGSAMGFVHHKNKGMYHEGVQINRGWKDSSGSKGLATWADSIWRVEPTESGNEVEVRFEKNRNGPPINPVTLHLNENTLVFEGSAMDVGTMIHEYVTQAPRDHTEITTYLTENAGIGIGKARDARMRAVSAGIIKEVKDPTDGRRKVFIPA